MLRFLSAAFVAALLVVPGSTIVSAQDANDPSATGVLPAAPLTDLIGTSETEVLVDPEAATVEATHRYRFRNELTDQVFTGFFETLPADASDVVATVGSRELTAVGIPSGNGLAQWLVSFDRPLEPGQEVSVVIRWRRDALTQDTETFDRASRDLVALAPFAVEHGDSASIRVEIPGAFTRVDPTAVAAATATTTEETGEPTDPWTVEEDDTGFVFSVSDVTGYETLPIVLEAPERFSRSPLLVAGLDITLAVADGPDPWVSGDLVSLINALRGWLPLPPPPPMEFRQGWTGGLGLRQIDDGIYVLPPAADAVLALRAITDVWMAEIEFTDADTELRHDFAAAVADRVGADAGYAVPARTGQWATAVDALVSVSDSSTVSTAIGALEVGVPAYPGADDGFLATPVDWRRFTDVFDHVAGVEATDGAMRLSATADELAELSRRDAALADYRALEARAAPWLMPPLLRDAMAAWEFDRFAEAQGSVSELVAARDEMIAAAAEVELEIGGYVQRRFEGAAESMDEAWELHAEQREALDHVAEALRLDTGDRGLLSNIGMAGRDADALLDRVVVLWNAGEFELAGDNADHLIDEYETSVGRGTMRLVVPGTIIVLVVLAYRAIVGWVRRRMAASRLAAAAAADQDDMDVDAPEGSSAAP